MAIPKKTEEQAHLAYLRYQKELESSIKELHKKTNEVIDKIIARNTNTMGYIERHKLRLIVDDYMRRALNEFRHELQSSIGIGVRASSVYGIRSILGAHAPENKATAWIWQEAAKRVNTNILTKRGLLDGLTLSERVWDLADDGMKRLKKIVSSGIMQGKSAASISRDVRGLLRQPATLRGRARALASPGQGVYRSAYKNALRLTASETNKAYIDGQNETAKLRGNKLKVKLSPAHPRRDVCDPYEDRIYEPGEGPLPLHPWCKCFYIEVPAEAV